MQIDNIKEYRMKMQEEFNTYIEAVKEFENNPCRVTKRKALEKGKIFSSTKNKMNVKIKDVWCREQN